MAKTPDPARVRPTLVAGDVLRGKDLDAVDPRLAQLIGRPAEDSQRWFAGRTRSRAEKAVYRALASVGVECYLPLIPHERRWADRVKRVDLPLFPGYIFVRSQRDELPSVLWVPGFVGVVRVDGRPSPVRDEELASVRALVEGVQESGTLPLPTAYEDLDLGQSVEVLEGPFVGMRGVLIQYRGKARVAVKLSAVRMAVSVELDRRSLRAARGS